MEVTGHPEPAHAVSVIIVSYNSAAALRRCLGSLATHLSAAEVIVVDNGSEDDSLAVATSHPGVRVISGHGNVGFGSAVNIGAAAAAADLLLVLNPDAIVVHVDAAGLRALAAAPVLGLRACRQAGGCRGQHALFAAWGWRRELSWWMFAWFLLPRRLPQPRPRPRGGQRRWINGSAFVARRGEFIAVGGFDESFFLYLEDFDLSRAYRLAGLPIEETGAVAVDHTHAQSSPRNEERMIAYAILGLVETAAKAGEGPAAAARALVLLEQIASVGRKLGWLPIIGLRARRKALSADTVRGLLADDAVVGLAGGRYHRARHALGARSRRG
jgi:N-acetylglucosaminyl-diphospho-decaprenol L-rhamnosyltransferase